MALRGPTTRRRSRSKPTSLSPPRPHVRTSIASTMVRQPPITAPSALTTGRPPTTIATSVAKTRALLTVEEGQVVCGVGAEVAFRSRENFDHLRVARLGARRMPVSSSPALEAHCLPNATRVAEAALQLLG